jgi:hypothetical protein
VSEYALIGSERISKTGAAGDTLKEGIGINKSLSALGDCIEKLAKAVLQSITHSASYMRRDSLAPDK